MQISTDFDSITETDSANYLTHYCAIILIVNTYKLNYFLSSEIMPFIHSLMVKNVPKINNFEPLSKYHAVNLGVNSEQ